MLYQIKRMKDSKEIEQCEKFNIEHYMWNSKQKPKVYGWLGYLEHQGLYVKMVCEEENPKREYRNHRDPVYLDSAMEVFLAFPEGAITNHCMYTNFEINANGAMLAQYGYERHHRPFLSDEQYSQAGVNAWIEPGKWGFEVLFPEEYLKNLCDFEAIKKGKEFYCNFYKVGETEEILHFGAFSPIESEKPDFHLPVYFTKVVIEAI